MVALRRSFVVVVLSLAGLFLLAFPAVPACSCLPLDDRGLAMADVPLDVIAEVARTAPGSRMVRAWPHGTRDELARGEARGHCTRVRSPRGWIAEDVQVAIPDRPRRDDSAELEPIDSH